MDPLRIGARLLSRGMRGGHAALTLVGGFLVARGIVRWLDRPDRELLYSRRIAPGETLKIRLAEPAD